MQEEKLQRNLIQMQISETISGNGNWKYPDIVPPYLHVGQSDMAVAFIENTD
jgi:hypothetical protein